VIAISAHVQHVATPWKQADEAPRIGQELRHENRCAGAVGEHRVGRGMCDQRQRGQMPTSSGVR